MVGGAGVADADRRAPAPRRCARRGREVGDDQCRTAGPGGAGGDPAGCGRRSIGGPTGWRRYHHAPKPATMASAAAATAPHTKAADLPVAFGVIVAGASG